MKSNGCKQLAVLIAGFALMAPACSKDEATATPALATDVAQAPPAAAPNAAVEPLPELPDDLGEPPQHGGEVAIPASAAPVPRAGAVPSVAARPPQAPAEAAATTTIDGDAYAITVVAPNTAKAASASKVTVSVVPKAGWKMNKDFPTKLKIEPPSGVSIAKPTLLAADATTFDAHRAVFDVVFTPASAGSKTFEADFKFAVCTDATCDPKKEKLAWVVDVK